MAEILGVGFVIAWFIFWAWMLVNKPATVMTVWKKSDESVKNTLGSEAKVVGTVVKHLPKQ